MPAAGSLVAWWDGGSLSLGVVAAEEKGRLRLVVPGGQARRVAPGRVSFVLGKIEGGPGETLEERKRAGRAAEEAMTRLREAASSVDVALLWELCRESDEPLSLASLCELALDRADPEARATLTLALLEDGVRFVRHGDDWEPRQRSAVDEILRQRDRESAKSREKAKALEALAAVGRGRPFEASGSREEKRYLQALEDLAVRGLQASDAARSLATEVLEASRLKYDRPDEGAFKLLRAIGRFGSDDENLQVLRYGLRTEFSEEVASAAVAAASRSFRREDRADLTGLEVITIDGPRTREIDDGLSLERVADDRVRLGVHIADPACYIEPGGAVDLEALARTVTFYLPDGRLPMLPPAISEEAASLTEGEERPALSFLVTVDPAGETRGFEVMRSIVRVRARLTYEDADGALGAGEGRWTGLLRDLDAVMRALESRRVADGAIRLVADEVDVHVDECGRVSLEHVPADSPSRLIVSEGMVLAGAVAARFCTEHGVPAIYRRQPPPDRLPEVPPEGIRDPATVRAFRRSLRRGEVGLQPGPHFALGLSAYAQATSPLRRYQDLATHRQIISILEGRPPFYDADALQRVAASTEAAEADGRRAEWDADRYWLLRYLEERTGEKVDGTVVDLDPRPVVLLDETLIEHPMPSLKGVGLGERIMLRIQHVNPRADLLSLRRVRP